MNFEKVMECLKKEHSIYSGNLVSTYYGKTVRPDQTPSKSVQLQYINENIDDFIEWVENHFSITINKCGKRKFTDYASKRALASCLLSQDHERKERSRYFCDRCNAWHLTSKKFNR